MTKDSPHVRVGRMLAEYMAAAHVLGRLQVAHLATKRSGKPVPLVAAARVQPRFAELELGFSVNLPPGREVEYIRNLTPVTREIFDTLTSQYQQLSFTVSGAADQRMVEKIRDALAEVATSGGTREDFIARVRQLTTEAGAEEINAFTLDTVFSTNMQKAYSLGRLEQMADPLVQAALPYWQYWTVGDGRVRPEHRVLHGFTARAEDPVWRKIYPPNGFNCRCSAVPLLPDEVPEDADTPGMERLPVLAMELVPQAGFNKVFA